MGWWVSNEHGGIDFDADKGEGSVLNHFPDIDDPQNPLWGDEPADILSDAFGRIQALFVKSWGRLPSVEELLRGVDFTVGKPGDSPLPLPATVGDAVQVTKEQQEIVSRHYYGAYDPCEGKDMRAEWEHIAPVMAAVTEPYTGPWKTDGAARDLSEG